MTWDDSRFDRIAKSVAAGASRRTLVGMFGTGLAGGLAAALLGGDGVAGKNNENEHQDKDGGDKRARGKKKKRNKGHKPAPGPTTGTCTTVGPQGEGQCVCSGLNCEPAIGSCVPGSGQCQEEGAECDCLLP